MGKTKRIIIAVIVGIIVFVVMFYMSGCNKQILDLNYSFTKAYIEGIGTIEIKSWNDYENSDMIQVISKDGTVYLTHSSNVILMNK